MYGNVCVESRCNEIKFFLFQMMVDKNTDSTVFDTLRWNVIYIENRKKTTLSSPATSLSRDYLLFRGFY